MGVADVTALVCIAQHVGGNTGSGKVVGQLGIGTVSHGKHQRIGIGDGVDLAVLFVADGILGNLGHLGLGQHVNALGKHARDEDRTTGAALGWRRASWSPR